MIVPLYDNTCAEHAVHSTCPDLLSSIPSNATKAVVVQFAVVEADPIQFADIADTVTPAKVVDALQTASETHSAATLGFGFPMLTTPPNLHSGWSQVCLAV